MKDNCPFENCTRTSCFLTDTLDIECTESGLSSSMTLRGFCKGSSSSREIFAKVEVLVSSDLIVVELSVVLPLFMSIPLDVSLREDNSCIVILKSLSKNRNWLSFFKLLRNSLKMVIKSFH